MPSGKIDQDISGHVEGHDRDHRSGQPVALTRVRRRLWPYGRPALLLVLAGALVAAVGATAVLIRPPSAEVPRNTFVADVPIGGLDDDAVRAALAGPVRERMERTVHVEVGAAAFDLRPSDAGIRLDQDATLRSVRQATAADDWVSRIQFWKQDRHDVPPVVSVDLDAARAALDTRLRDYVRPTRDAVVRLATPDPVLEAKGDASYAASGRGVTVQAGESGQSVDLDAAVDLLVRAVRAGTGDAIRLPLVTEEPGTDTPELTGVDQLIGTFTTYHPCCQGRVTNIHRIAQLIDDTVIAPGATFSLNQAAGQRTAERGFVPAPAIVDGELVDQLGGGVSQFSTTLFNAAWFAGLPILDHQPHSKYISRYPPGREATLDWGNIDQVIRNNTNAPLVIRTATTATSLTVALYGHTGDRSVSSVTGPREPSTGDGFGIVVRRTVRQDGTIVGTDTLRWTYTGLD